MIKLTTWNAEFLDYDWGVVLEKYSPGQKLFGKNAPSKSDAQDRINAVRDFIGLLDADILFLCEAPKGVEEMKAFSERVTPEYELITRPNAEKYHIAGSQWLWFLIKKRLADRISPKMISVGSWREFAARESPSINSDGTWWVAAPKLNAVDGGESVAVVTRQEHSFYREPQILSFSFGGTQHEVIGVHLKSKHTGIDIPERLSSESLDQFIKRSEDVRTFLAEAHEARIKLASEATAIRSYIDHRFKQELDPSILVVGDLNDGPGKELMEREYLLHDLLSNLQGDMFFVNRLLHHALIDQPQALRWTSKFKDYLDPMRSEFILLDHILFTQSLTQSGTSPLEVRANSGWVEHLAFETAESSIGGSSTLSDHRPVSVEMTPRTN